MAGDRWRRKGTPSSTSCSEGCVQRGPCVSSFLRECRIKFMGMVDEVLIISANEVEVNC